MREFNLDGNYKKERSLLYNSWESKSKQTLRPDGTISCKTENDRLKVKVLQKSNREIKDIIKNLLKMKLLK